MPEKITPSFLSQKNIAEKISNVNQVGGIETSVIDNGYGRGTRIAWFNTGSGFRFKVVLDKAMDVADAFYNEYGIAWISNAGIVPQQTFPDKGLDWLRTFGGGLFTTCGLSHVGGPEKDESGERGLHGLISNIPAELESVIQPDPHSGRMNMSISGSITEARIFGPHLRMRRTISAELGEPWVNVSDEITNRGNTSAPLMLLYHCNFGWPLVNEGAKLIYNGDMYLVNQERDKHIFNEQNDFRTCPAVLSEHQGSGEAAAYFDIHPDPSRVCRAGIYNQEIDLGVTISFRKDQLPWLTNWQHWGRGEYVTGIEPGTNPPIGQSAARKNKTLIFIEPGETRTFGLRFDVFRGVAAYRDLVKQHN